MAARRRELRVHVVRFSQGGSVGEAERMLMVSAESMEQLKAYGRELQQMRIPTDVFRR